MKVLIVAFLYTLAAVQGRSAFDKSGTSPGDNRYMVHVRVAPSNGNGLLHTCAGSYIGSTWVLTSTSCIKNSRFIWLRFGAEDVTRPELVVEGNLVAHENDDLALLNVNRAIGESDNIGSVGLADAEATIPDVGQFCSFGAENNAPGNNLTCSDVSLDDSDGEIIAVTDGTQFDLGAPLVSDGVQIGVLTEVGDPSVFAPVASSRDWIKNITGL